MPRSKFFATSEFPYHVTARCNNREWFHIDLKTCWQIFSDQLCESSLRYSAIVHSFVLMDNHYHSIITTPDANLDRFMRHFNSGVATTIQRVSKRENHVFGARYRASVLSCPYSVGYATKYVYRNPVRAGICDRVEDYRYSTLNLCSSSHSFPIADGIGRLWDAIPKAQAERLKWLNQPTTKEAEEMVRRALRRSQFKFPTNSNHQNLLRKLRAEYAVEPSSATF